MSRDASVLKGGCYHGITWSADGRDIIASSGKPGRHFPLEDSVPQPRIGPNGSRPVGDQCRQPAVAIQQRRLAFTRARWDVEQLEPRNVRFGPSGRQSGQPDWVQPSRAVRAVLARWNSDRVRERAVGNARDLGRRSGWPECPAIDGVQWPPRRHGGVVAGRPVDCLRSARDDGRADIYVMSARGGAERRITDHPADDLNATWSRDGRWIYFASTRTGTQQVWKVSPQGGEAVPVTKHGGGYAKESLDGRYIYYPRLENPLPTLWRVPVDGGEEVQVVRVMASWANFAVARDGIYFESPHPGTLGLTVPYRHRLPDPRPQSSFSAFRLERSPGC